MYHPYTDDMKLCTSWIKYIVLNSPAVAKLDPDNWKYIIKDVLF